jgi:hypothetical protein
MTVLITLTVAGADSGPFDLYSNTDGFVSAFETGVSKASLLAGYSSSAVPNFTTVIRVLSTGDCTNFINITLDAPITTTTTTTGGPGVPCNNIEIYPPIFNPGTYHDVQYLDCAGNLQSVSVPNGGSMVTICATSIVSDNGNGVTSPLFTICI